MENIRVTTQELEKKQEEWLAVAKRGEEAFLNVADMAGKLEECFCGQIVYSLKRDFHKLGIEGKRAFGELCVHLKKLSVIAMVYDEAERSNTGVITDN